MAVAASFYLAPRTHPLSFTSSIAMACENYRGSLMGLPSSYQNDCAELGCIGWGCDAAAESDSREMARTFPVSGSVSGCSNATLRKALDPG